MVEGHTTGGDDPGMPPPDATTSAMTARALRQPSKWPTVIGVISLVYALFGLTCASIGGAYTLVQPILPPMFGGGAAMPPLMKWFTIGSLVVSIGLGILMLRGAIAVLHRHPAGVRRLRLWSVLRLVFVVVGIVGTVLTLPAQLQYQRNVQDAVIEQFGDDMPAGTISELSDEQLWQHAMIRTAIMTGVVTIYPLFLGFFLFRKSVDQEAARWMSDDWDRDGWDDEET